MKLFLLFFFFLPMTTQAFIGMNAVNMHNQKPIWSQSLAATAGATLTPRGIVKDSAGNIYIAGETDGNLGGNTSTGSIDIYLQKFNSSGVSQWVRQLGVPTRTSGAYGLAIDSADNLYVAGTSQGNLDGQTGLGSNDAFVVKYDSSGNKQWTRLTGIATKITYGQNVTVDSSNHIYVVGTTSGGLDGNTLTGTSDFFVTKYDSTGTKLWTRQLGVATKATYGWSVVTDSSDDLYVVCHTTGGLDGNTLTGLKDLCVTKYDSTGAKQWTRQLGVATKSVEPHDIAVDTNKDIYAVGSVNGNLDGNTLTGTKDVFFTKYSSAGVKQFTRMLGVATKETNGMDIIVDASFNIYVNGHTNGNLDGQTLTGSWDLFLIKYNSGGTKQWTRLLGVASSIQSGYALTRDGTDVIATGYSSGNLDGHTRTGFQDHYYVRYDDTGAKVSSVLYGGQSNISYFPVNGMTALKNGGAAITGTVTGATPGNTKIGNDDSWLAYYNSRGTRLWITQFGVATKTVQAQGVASDSTSNVYVGGHTTAALNGNPLTGTQDFFIVKYDPVGAIVWTRLLGVATKAVTVGAITSDSSDNVYITGYTTGGLDGNTLTGTSDMFVTKYASDGTKQWTRQLGVATKYAQAKAITVDSSLNVYVMGVTNGNLDGNTLAGPADFFVTKYNSTGVKQWTRTLGGAGVGLSVGGIAVDSSGNTYVAGYASGNFDGNTSLGPYDTFITKYNTSGTKQWTRTIGKPSSDIACMAITIDDRSNLYLTGRSSASFDGTAITGYNDIIIMKFNSSGTKKWTKQYGSSLEYSEGKAIVSDQKGNFFVTGSGNGIDYTPAIAKGRAGIMLMKFGGN